MEVSVTNNLSVARLIRELRPDILLSPTAATNQHPDHVVVSRVARNAARLARYGGVSELADLPPHSIRHHLEYAITPGGEPSRERLKTCIDVSAQVKRWIDLMQCHATQLRTRRYLELQIARARVLGLTSGVEYAQALYPADDFLIDSLGNLPVSIRLF
jgi:LmbE family N-acetylglucosaminyl deacetylase